MEYSLLISHNIENEMTAIVGTARIEIAATERLIVDRSYKIFDSKHFKLLHYGANVDQGTFSTAFFLLDSQSN